MKFIHANINGFNNDRTVEDCNGGFLMQGKIDGSYGFIKSCPSLTDSLSSIAPILFRPLLDKNDIDLTPRCPNDEIILCSSTGMTPLAWNNAAIVIPVDNRFDDTKYDWQRVSVDSTIDILGADCYTFLSDILTSGMYNLYTECLIICSRSPKYVKAELWRSQQIARNIIDIKRSSNNPNVLYEDEDFMNILRPLNECISGYCKFEMYDITRTILASFTYNCDMTAYSSGATLLDTVRMLSTHFLMSCQWNSNDYFVRDNDTGDKYKHNLQRFLIGFDERFVIDRLIPIEAQCTYTEPTRNRKDVNPLDGPGMPNLESLFRGFIDEGGL